MIRSSEREYNTKLGEGSSNLRFVSWQYGVSRSMVERSSENLEVGFGRQWVGHLFSLLHRQERE